MMKTLGTLAIVGCASVAVSSTALAAGKPLRGSYVGVSGSYETYDVDARAGSLSAKDLNLGGINGGVFVGRNFDLNSGGRWIGGVEGSLTVNGADGSAKAGADRIAVSSRYTYELAARAGYAVTPETLAYGRLGWARTKFDVAGVNKPILDGVRFGGGVEHMIGKSTAVRSEFTRTYYETDRTAASRIDPAQNQLSFGLAVFF
jgi:outer membrane immunogenic protein